MMLRCMVKCCVCQRFRKRIHVCMDVSSTTCTCMLWISNYLLDS